MDEDRVRFVVSGFAAAYEHMPTDERTIEAWINVLGQYDEEDVKLAVKAWFDTHITEWPTPAQISHLIVLRRDLAPRMMNVAREAYLAERARLGKPPTSSVFADLVPPQDAGGHDA